jgi:hypothetical protein
MLKIAFGILTFVGAVVVGNFIRDFVTALVEDLHEKWITSKTPVSE